MSTATEQETIELVSPHANYWLSLSTNVDDYNQMGGMRMAQQGQRIRFARGRATVPASWREALEAHPKYGADFFFASDAGAGRAAMHAGPTVVSGQLRSGNRPGEVSEPPLPGWDTTGARGIRAAIDAGKVADLRGAMAYETRPDGGKARAQVIEAIGKALRAESPDDGDEGDDLPLDNPEAEGFVAPVPDDAGGL